MAMSHAACTHPRTPAGRAACRRLRETIKADHGATGPATQRANLDAALAFDRARTGRAGKGPQTAVEARSGRTPTRNRKEPEPTIPDAFTALLDTANREGWSILRPISRSIRNAGEFSIKVRSEHGTVYAIWHTDGAIGLQWRSRRTSVTRRIATVAQGIEYLRG